MNIHEFAKLCGVSSATASRYFSGNAAMSPELSARIRKIAEDTGYKPSEKYQRRKGNGNNTIVAIIPYLHHRFQVDLLSDLQEYIVSLGHQMIIICQHETDMLRDCVSQIKSINPAGIILLHEGSDTDFTEFFNNAPTIPMVLCSGLSMTRKVSTVHIDDLIAAYDGANYLIGLGHKSVVLISDQAEAIGSGSQRILGCKKAFFDAKLSLPDEHIAHAWYSFDDGYTAMNELLSRGLKFTAVFVFSDEMAAGAIAALHDHGLKVPEDISVLGFDNSSQALETRPMLSTVGQPAEQIARRSVDLVISGGYDSKVESIILPHTIVERQSCKGLNSGGSKS